MRPRSRWGAGMAAHPGRLMPSASARAFMVEAVPIVLQCPGEGADDAPGSTRAPSSISPAASISRAFQMMVPDPVRSPLYQPLSIGPPDGTLGGRLTVVGPLRAR